VAFPFAAANAIREISHAIEHGMDFGYHVLSVNYDRLVFRCAKGDVQHRSLFGDVDLLAAEHCVDASAQA
jgi:hypothetical protein